MSDGPSLDGLNQKLGRLLMNRAADPSNDKKHFEAFFDSVAAEYGESGAHFGALFASVVTARVQNMNINITGGQVGNFNVGQQIGTVTAAINVLAATSDEPSKNLATALKNLTEAVHESKDLTPEQKKDNLDLLADLATQAQAEPTKRSTGVLKSVLTTLGGSLSAVGTLSTLWQHWSPAVRAYFNLP